MQALLLLLVLVSLLDRGSLFSFRLAAKYVPTYDFSTEVARVVPVMVSGHDCIALQECN